MPSQRKFPLFTVAQLILFGAASAFGQGLGVSNAIATPSASGQPPQQTRKQDAEQGKKAKPPQRVLKAVDGSRNLAALTQPAVEPQNQWQPAPESAPRKTSTIPSSQNQTDNSNSPAASNSAPKSSDENSPAKSPLSFKIGDAQFTPGGFMDFTAFFRSTNVGSGIGTAFGSIPFSGTSAGSLTETRLTMQNSRLSLMATSNVKSLDVTGYVEADFLGNAPANVFVTSNSNTLRARLYWVRLRKNKFEFLGGQSWSLLTPNRSGLSPLPSDIFYSQDMDTNYQVGLVWSRQAGARFIYHATKTVAAGIAIEDPQQYVGTSTLPSTFPASQVETGSGNTATPNAFPDVIAKVAFDPSVHGLHQHIEVGGLLTSARVYDPGTNLKNTAIGGAGTVNMNFELFKGLHAVLNTFYGDGGGRYIFGLGPQFVVRPDANSVLAPAMLHSGSTNAGIEYQVTRALMLYGYYGGAYYDRYTSVDPVTGKAIGFGYPGAPNSQNKSIQEATLGVIQTFWKNPRYGALQLITQYSYVSREPWFVAAATPKNAHVSMGYVDIRYVLP